MVACHKEEDSILVRVFVAIVHVSYSALTVDIAWRGDSIDRFVIFCQNTSISATPSNTRLVLQ